MAPVDQSVLPAHPERNESTAGSSEPLAMLQAEGTQVVGRPLDVSHEAPVEPDQLRNRLAVGAVVLVALALAVLALPGLDDLRSRLARVDPEWLALAALLEMASCAAFVVAFRGIMCRQLPWRFSARIGMAVQGTNVLVPTGGAGGLAFAAWALHRAGMSSRAIARRTVTLFVATSSVNFLTALAGGVLLALGIVAGDVAPALWLGPAAAALLVIVVVAQVPWVLDRFRPRLRGRLAAETRRAVADGIRDVGRLPRQRRLGAVLGAAGYMFFDLAALAAAFAAVGAPLELGILLVAYPLGQLGGLIPLPGGVGGTDGALIGVFVLYGSPLAAATAAVLAYRVFQLGIPALLAAPAIGGTLQALRRRPEVLAPCDTAPAAA